MALIAMCVYSTPENKKDECLEKTLQSLKDTVDFTKHRLKLWVNGYTDKTFGIINSIGITDTLSVFKSKENIGTAMGINKIWQHRRPNENCIKMDDDVVIHQSNWIEDMEKVIEVDPTIGQVGLKRKDCWENPNHADPFYRTTFREIARIKVESSNHIMGTCVMHSAALLDKVGYLYQPKLYGFDDVFMSLRSKLSGFDNVFIPHVEIDHIDAGDTPYQKWKEQHASECWQVFNEMKYKFITDPNSIYYNPFGINETASNI